MCVCVNRVNLGSLNALEGTINSLKFYEKNCIYMYMGSFGGKDLFQIDLGVTTWLPTKFGEVISPFDDGAHQKVGHS